MLLQAVAFPMGSAFEVLSFELIPVLDELQEWPEVDIVLEWIVARSMESFQVLQIAEIGREEKRLQTTGKQAHVVTARVAPSSR